MMYDALKKMLLGEADSQLDKLAAFLRDIFEVRVSNSTLSCALKAKEWSKKTVRRKVKEQLGS